MVKQLNSLNTFMKQVILFLDKAGSTKERNSLNFNESTVVCKCPLLRCFVILSLPMSPWLSGFISGSGIVGVTY